MYLQVSVIPVLFIKLVSSILYNDISMLGGVLMKRIKMTITVCMVSCLMIGGGVALTMHLINLYLGSLPILIGMFNQ